MPVVYADAADLEDWLPTDLYATVSADAERLLRRASEIIDGLVTLPYQVDATTKLPTDTTLAEAMRDATCAQVEFWIEVGEENDIDGLAGTDIRIGGYSGYMGKRPPVLAPRALRILRSAGMFTQLDMAVWP